MRASSRATSWPTSHSYCAALSCRSASQTVGCALHLDQPRIRAIEQQREQAVSAAVLVHRGRAVPYPLARNEDRHRAVELELDHLEGRRVVVAAEVTDEPTRLARASRAVAVGDARRDR